MNDFEKNKVAVHKSLVNLNTQDKAMLIASCTLKGIEIEKLEDTITTIMTGLQRSMKGLLEKNTRYLSK